LIQDSHGEPAAPPPPPEKSVSPPAYPKRPEPPEEPEAHSQESAKSEHSKGSPVSPAAPSARPTPDDLAAESEMNEEADDSEMSEQDTGGRKIRQGIFEIYYKDKSSCISCHEGSDTLSITIKRRSSKTRVAATATPPSIAPTAPPSTAPEPPSIPTGASTAPEAKSSVESGRESPEGGSAMNGSKETEGIQGENSQSAGKNSHEMQIHEELKKAGSHAEMKAIGEQYEKGTDEVESARASMNTQSGSAPKVDHSGKQVEAEEAFDRSVAESECC
ncbi:hypothetical protein COOONC_25711, partial [Cooperia oncophora]